MNLLYQLFLIAASKFVYIKEVLKCLKNTLSFIYLGVLNWFSTHITNQCNVLIIVLFTIQDAVPYMISNMYQIFSTPIVLAIKMFRTPRPTQDFY